MQRKRRRMRVPVIVGCVIGALFLTYMALHFGHDHDQSLQTAGPMDAHQSHSTTAKPLPSPSPGVDTGALYTPTGQARLEIIVSRGPGKVWLDNRPVHMGKQKVLTIKAGSHVLLFKEKQRTTTQKLVLSPNDFFHITFGDGVDVRANTPEPATP